MMLGQTFMFLLYLILVSSSHGLWFQDCDLVNLSNGTSKCNDAIRNCALLWSGPNIKACVKGRVREAVCDRCIDELSAVVYPYRSNIEFENIFTANVSTFSQLCTEDNEFLCNFGCLSSSWTNGVCIKGQCTCNKVHTFTFITPVMSTKLLNLMDFQKENRWVKIYHASIDGFDPITFHNRCDLKYNTLVIVKSTNNYVFGGYTKETWNSYETGKPSFKKDSDAFIFSLENSRNIPIIFRPKESIEYSIVTSHLFFPIFGNNDLAIRSNSNAIGNLTPSSSITNFYDKTGTVSYADSQSFLAGSTYFQIEDFAVYMQIL